MPCKFLHGLYPEIFATNLFKDPLFLSMEKEIIGWSMQREVFTSMVPKIGVKFLTIFENKSHFLALKTSLRVPYESSRSKHDPLVEQCLLFFIVLSFLPFYCNEIFLSCRMVLFLFKY